MDRAMAEDPRLRRWRDAKVHARERARAGHRTPACPSSPASPRWGAHGAQAGVLGEAQALLAGAAVSA